MLTKKQIEEIKEHLEKAQNPIFYYDNDADGLCSFLLLRRYLGRGKGVAIKSYPELNAQYAHKALEFNSDYVFVLDKPLISREFVEEIGKMHLPLIWIDHHDIAGNEMFDKAQNFYVYNSARNKGEDKSSEPTTYLIYKTLGQESELWLAVIGCIADCYMPDFIENFAEKYPEFWKKGIEKPFDAFYRTEIGKIAQAFNFGLKDSITHVVMMQNFLISCKSPKDVFSESKENEFFRKKYSEITKKYKVLIDEAKKNAGKKLLFFEYSGDLSISSEIANELSYLCQDKYIVVAYKKGSITNISMRGKNASTILEKALKGLEGASGGGHQDAVGARIRTEHLTLFKDALIKEINEQNGRS